MACNTGLFLVCCFPFPRHSDVDSMARGDGIKKNAERIKYICGTRRFMFVGNGVKINGLLRGRLRLHGLSPPLTAEQESVKDINLNISHAWGTPHEENKLAHPCISSGKRWW